MQAVGSFCVCLRVGTSKQPKSGSPGLSNFPHSESQTPPTGRNGPSSDILINNRAPTETHPKGILKREGEGPNCVRKNVTFAEKLVPSANSSSIDSDNESHDGDAVDKKQKDEI